MNPFEWVVANSQSSPGMAALSTVKGNLSRKQFEATVRSVGTYLRNTGVKPGDFVGLTLPTNIQILFTWGCLLVGAVLIPTGAKLPRDLQGKLDWHFSVAETPDSDSIRITEEVIRDIRSLGGLVEPYDFPSKDSIVALLGTSGTTGERKFTVYDLGTFVTRATRSIWGEEDHSGPVMNLFGIGQAAGFFSNMQDLYFGRPMLVDPGRSSVQTHLEMIEMFRPTTLRGSPNQVVQLLSHQDANYHRINSIRTVSVIGSPLDDRMAKSILSSLPEVQINVGYGSTEAGISNRRVLSSLSENKVDFLGTQVAAEVEIFSEDGQKLPPGQSGLIAIRSDNMVREYFNNPEATSKHFKNGFFLSGDRGRLDSEGKLWMEGRESELINFGGTKIDPQRIDSAALSKEGLKDACAFVFSDAQGMQHIGLAVVPIDKNFDPKTFAEELNKTLGPVLMPRRYVVVSGIPRNAMGKPMRNVLTERLSQASNKR